ncbi:prepilin-type N-terminal cleavage/methylation domain-containing protein [Desulfolutivibrio sp.]|uniref:prepilin-type N-terminal cleavage/methylation domain-containing protein n=1 Tax=Desulfolutivibrio sp. TaxID=2773296 RepID=UPI002F9666F1
MRGKAAGAPGKTSLPKRHSGSEGFTLLEVVAVLVLLGILAAVVVARFADNNADTVAEAEIFKSHLRYAQLRAMGDIVPWSIVINAPGSYTLYKGADASGTPQNLPGASGSTHALDSDVTISGGAIAFDWRGQAAVTGGDVAFTGESAIVLSVYATTGFAYNP